MTVERIQINLRTSEKVRTELDYLCVALGDLSQSKVIEQLILAAAALRRDPEAARAKPLKSDPLGLFLLRR